MEDLPNYLTAKMIAKYTSLSLRRVYEFMALNPAHGGIPSFNVGRSVLVKQEDFIMWWSAKVEDGTKKWGKG